MQNVVDGVVLFAGRRNDTAGPHTIVAQLHVVVVLEAIKQQRLDHRNVLLVQVEAAALVGQERDVVYDRPRPAAVVAGEFLLAEVFVQRGLDDFLLQVAHRQEGVQLEQGVVEVVIDALHHKVGELFVCGWGRDVRDCLFD